MQVRISDIRVEYAKGEGATIMVEIRRSRTDDLGAILELADSVFYDDKGQPEDFAALLPKLYGEDADCTDNHWLLFEDGRLQSLVLVQTMEYQAVGLKLPIAAIGTVSVSKEARGKGYMKLLMDQAVQELDEQGIVFTALGGQRQRYAYWGFEPCGLHVSYSISEANIRHAYGTDQRDTLTFKPMEPGSPEEEIAFQMYNTKSVRMNREKRTFYDILSSWRATPLCCFAEGEQAGYAVIKQEGNRVKILELVLSDSVSARVFLQGIFKEFGLSGCNISLPLYEQKLIRQLEAICEQETLVNNYNYRIHDWKTLLDSFLKVKATYQKLQDGCLSLEITSETGAGARINICIKQGIVTVTDGEGEADVHFSESAAARVLFYDSKVAEALPDAVPAGWFPLPLYMAEQDCC